MSGETALKLTADVLVIGGGPAGAWAAWSAASKGAKVVLVDKGYLGSSGATAPGGTNLLYLPPDKEMRDKAVRERMASGGYLSEAGWIHRVLDQVYINLERVEQWGYPFVRDENGVPQRNHLQGPEYMALMRKTVKKAGVKVLDHAPALELLVDEHGVGGARGALRQQGKDWEVRAGAVVIATGGCAFLSKGLGCNVLTGDGYLMGAEVGAELSGMEFSRRYAPAPAFSSNTRSRLLGWATYYDQDGKELKGSRNGDFLAERLLEGPVYAIMNKADTPEKRAILRSSHAIFFLPYDRAGIDVFTQPFPLTLRYEGTVRGTGGLRIVDDNCETTVPGLYAAGDAATRERITGAASGGGAFNASWAICSGTWSGEGAARYALSQRAGADSRQLRSAGRYGLAETTGGRALSSPRVETAELVRAIQDQVFPLQINYFRSEVGLKAALNKLHSYWPSVNEQAPGNVHERVHAREAAAMAATARWIYTAGLARKETRGAGLHLLAEYPDEDPNQHHRLLVSGLETIRTRPDRTFLGGASAASYPGTEQGA
ncbi:pyridine nucleotide-disulfide oxidoreductase [Cohnella sp. CIP 111063]|uniref:FAD-dependent oxidoreductase n=1 Tax=unclassified Cohnella TaxID=2636738 RepID=UPI000B8C4566|nr:MULTISPECIES: FAD-binding protein [unclassified Cohnella]OXS52841.1 pyridine nucleotide-disulfide oxidoreductase [Cohnella sp. CIP 111063]PRX59814.1 succinate dehydrogenase/fumarate reductase flavoprotein subunit [Cohnella sp. SGD-V74]